MTETQNASDESSAQDERICSECVAEGFLSAEIQKTGTQATCSYCGERGQTWALDELAESIETAFEDHYIRTSENPDSWKERLLADKESEYIWEREGEAVLEAIEQADGIPSQAAADIVELLSEKHGDFEAAIMGEETEFHPDSYYELRGPSDHTWQNEWRYFEHSLKTEARFFSRSAAGHLAAIFGDIDKLKARDGRPLVVDSGPESAIDHLFRAREFQSEAELLESLCRPDVGLAPPPARRATAGRMNSRGITVFYGAESPHVAIAEVRPPVGSRVAVAKFSIIRPLRLLDLTALTDVHDAGSIFDPTLKDRLERVAFLQSLGQKISRPVMPNDQDLDYLATQAVADFLATENEPRLDGIIFMSAQCQGGRNVVLFHKSAKVKEIDLPPGTELSAGSGYHCEDGYEPYYSVRERVPPEAALSNRDQTIQLASLGSINMPGCDDDHREPTLKVNPDSVEVHDINRVTVHTTTHQVHRNRYG